MLRVRRSSLDDPVACVPAAAARPRPPSLAWSKVLARSGDELADTAGGSDALLGDLGELLGADDAGRLGELALAEDLEEALVQRIINY